MKKLLTSIVACSLTVGLFAQVTPGNRQNATDASINKFKADTPKSNLGKKSSTGNSVASDTGAQRPILLKKNGLSAYINFDSKYYYNSNPLAADGKIKQQATGVWDNTFSSTFGIGAFELGNSVVTPFIGASWTSTDHSEKVLEGLNRNSTNAFLLFLSNYGNGWSSKVGLNYANVRYTETDTEEYMDTNPYVSLRYSHILNNETSGAAELSIGTRNSKSDDLFARSDKVLDRNEVSLNYSLSHDLGDLTLSPSYTILYKKYSESVNQNRKDFLNNIAIRADYSINSSLALYINASYNNQNSSGSELGDQVGDYDSWNGGLGIGLRARF